MKNLKTVFYNNDWYCPYCEQLNNTEKIEKTVQCTWCECESHVPATVYAVFLHDSTNRHKRKKETTWTE